MILPPENRPSQIVWLSAYKHTSKVYRVLSASANTLIWCKKKKDLLSHYEFRKAVALVLIAPEEYYNRFEAEEESVASGSTSSSTT